MNKSLAILNRRLLAIVILTGCCAIGNNLAGQSFGVLHPADFKHYVDYFNRMEDENIVQSIPNDSAWNWMKHNIPLFECPQDNFE